MARAGLTRVLLIETAERLFAERGVNGVSLREVSADAGQRNTSAVLYHFGSKQALVMAVFEHRMRAINERRLAMLAAFDEHALGADLRALTEAQLIPLGDALGEPGRPSWYMRFCVHAALVDQEAVAHIEGHDWSAGLRTVRERVLDALADLPDEVRTERWNLFSLYTIHALADREAIVQHRPEQLTSSRSAFLTGLVDTAVALLAAPSSSLSLRGRRRR